MAYLVAAQALQERREIVGVLLFLRQDLLEQAPRGRIVLAEVVDHLAVAVDGDALGDQVFLDHVLERVAFDVLRVTPGSQAIGREVRLAAELRDALGDLIGVLALFLRVLEKLRGDGFRMAALRREVMALVTQRADDFRGERFVQQLEHHAAVGVIAGSDRPLGDVLPGALSQRADVRQECAATRFGHFVVLAVEPVADFRPAESEACFCLMSALALSYCALASFSHALSSLPFCASHFSFATLYWCSALASSTLRWLAGVGSYLAFSSAFATFSLPLASASHASLPLPFMSLHFARSDLYSASILSSSALRALRSTDGL